MQTAKAIHGQGKNRGDWILLDPLKSKRLRFSSERQQKQLDLVAAVLVPTLPSLFRCSATSLTESCSTSEAMMCGWLPSSPFLASRWLLQKCSTAVWSTMLLDWNEFHFCLFFSFRKRQQGTFWRYLGSARGENDVLGVASDHSCHVLPGLSNDGLCGQALEEQIAMRECNKIMLEERNIENIQDRRPL